MKLALGLLMEVPGHPPPPGDVLTEKNGGEEGGTGPRQGCPRAETIGGASGAPVAI